MWWLNDIDNKWERKIYLPKKEKRVSSSVGGFNSERNLISRFLFQLELKRFNSNLIQVKFIRSCFNGWRL